MDNEAIKKHIGKHCNILVTYGAGVNLEIGKIINVNENWIELETKKGIKFINVQFVQSIEMWVR